LWLGLYLVSFLAALLTLLRMRVRDHQRHLALQRREHERQRMMEEAQRQRDTISHLNRVAALGELATSLAHEINQPLGAILANAEASLHVLNTPAPDLADVRAALADIVEDGQRAGTVIQKMRSMLRPGDYKSEALDLNIVVREALLLVMNDASLRSIMLSLELAPDLPPVFSDSIQLQQVILNLVTNGMDAVTAAPATNRALVIRTWPALDGKHAVLEVEDSGSGIAAFDLDRIFDPFFTTKSDGMGMGLAISRSIVELSGGRIWAENSPSGGALFKVRLRTKAPQTADSERARSSGAG
jgi:C4-dicarboxylate-specific signal transduction histidine kinase